jgi:hypothetical protein
MRSSRLFKRQVSRPWWKEVAVVAVVAAIYLVGLGACRIYRAYLLPG